MPLPFRLRTFNPPLPAAGAWQLSFTDDGVGFISKVHPDACVKWVREVFRLSLHENDAGDRFLYDREANACLKLESLARQMTQMVFSYESADHGSFKSEVYVFQCPGHTRLLGSSGSCLGRRPRSGAPMFTTGGCAEIRRH